MCFKLLYAYGILKLSQSLKNMYSVKNKVSRKTTTIKYNLKKCDLAT